MDSNSRPDPTPEERAEAQKAIEEFMAAQDKIPEPDRVVIKSEKYDGPIGEPAESPPANSSTGDGRKE